MEIEDNGYYNLNTNGVQLLPVRVNVSATGSRLQDNKKVVITNNGTNNIVPDEGYDGMKSVTTEVNVESDVKIQDSKEITITQNGNDTVVPDTGYNGIASVFIKTQVPSPVSQDVKSVTYTENNTYTVVPDDPYTTMKSVNVTVNTPVVNVQNMKIVEYLQNANYTIVPDSGYDALKTVVVRVLVPINNLNITSIMYKNSSGGYTNIPINNVQSSIVGTVSFSANTVVLYQLKDETKVRVAVFVTDTDAYLNNISKYMSFRFDANEFIFKNSANDRLFNIDTKIAANKRTFAIFGDEYLLKVPAFN